MLPAQYATNIMAEATLFLVKPATLDEIMDKLMGNPATNAIIKYNPANLLPVLGPKRTRIEPMRLCQREPRC